jgi:hypothetical protein
METKRFTEFQESQIEELDWGELERLSSLQRLVCELLAKNQKLRMELATQRVEVHQARRSASLSE